MHNISMLNLSLNELNLVAKRIGIKSYKNMSNERLLSAVSESESVESATLLRKNSFDNERLKKTRKDFNEVRDFQKPQIIEIRKNLYDIKKRKRSFNGVVLKTKK